MGKSRERVITTSIAAVTYLASSTAFFAQEILPGQP